MQPRTRSNDADRQVAYTPRVKAVFVKLPALAKYRDHHPTHNAFVALPADLMKAPTAGDAIAGTGGLRKPGVTVLAPGAVLQMRTSG